MPGLVGAVSLNGRKINPDLLPAMRDAIRHRGWYQVDDYVNTKETLAISRVNLGIINKETQPYLARNGQVKVFLHGDIYNDEIANSSPLEFIYRLYEKHQLNFASFLNGSFVVVIVDDGEDTVLIANDRIAYKPLFYFSDSQAFYFGPEMKSLLLVPSLERRLNLAAVADFLTNGHFTVGHTLIENLETMDRATVLKLTISGVSKYKYWEHKFEVDKDRGLRYYQEKMVELLGQALRRRLRTDNSYGILLSGGLDSRGILGAYIRERQGRDLHTMSWGREEDIPNSDCVIAKRLARRIGAKHRFYKLTADEIINDFRKFIFFGEGLTDFPESYDVFSMIKEQQGIDIVLRGDHYFGSASWLKVHNEHTMFNSIPLKALAYIKEYQRILKPSYYQLFCKLDSETIRHVSSRCNANNIFNRRNFFYTDVRTRFYFAPLNYVKNFAIESVSPLLDYDFLDFVTTLPVKYILGKAIWKKSIAEEFPDLADKEAQNHNMIDWAASFKDSPGLKRFVYQNLIEDQTIFSDFICMDSLKRELDIFFSALSDSPHIITRVRLNALKRLETLPNAYRLAHKFSYFYRKTQGNLRDFLPPEWLILRLLILKMWGEVFLNYPVVREE
jgi:asparagine synthetase B (glutamine-hydrolysing)